MPSAGGTVDEIVAEGNLTEPQIPTATRYNQLILKAEFWVENLLPNRIQAIIEIYEIWMIATASY